MHIAEEVTLAVAKRKVLISLVRHLGVRYRLDSEGLAGPAVSHIVELKASLCYLRLALSLPLESRFG